MGYIRSTRIPGSVDPGITKNKHNSSPVSRKKKRKPAPSNWEHMSKRMQLERNNFEFDAVKEQPLKIATQNSQSSGDYQYNNYQDERKITEEEMMMTTNSMWQGKSNKDGRNRVSSNASYQYMLAPKIMPSSQGTAAPVADMNFI